MVLNILPSFKIKMQNQIIRPILFTAALTCLLQFKSNCWPIAAPRPSPQGHSSYINFCREPHYSKENYCLEIRNMDSVDTMFKQKFFKNRITVEYFWYISRSENNNLSSWKNLILSSFFSFLFQLPVSYVIRIRTALSLMA